MTDSITHSVLRDAHIALSGAYDYLDRFADVEDGDYGQPQANDALRLLSVVGAALARLDQIMD